MASCLLESSFYPSVKRTLFVCFLTFLYVLLMSVLIHFVFLPMIPSIHAGDGLLLGSDSHRFHFMAVSMAEDMKLYGLGSFELRPRGQAPVGVAAFLYWFFDIYKPFVVLPLNAFLYSVSSACIYYLLCSIMSSRIALISMLPFVLFPGAMSIYSQLHKDVFSIASVCMLALSLSIVVSSKALGLKRYLFSLFLFILSGGLLYLVRPYLIKVAFCGLLLSFFVVFFVFFRHVRFRRKRYKHVVLLSLLLIAFGLWDFVPVKSSKGLSFSEGVSVSVAHKGNTSLSDKVLRKIERVRRGFSNYKHAGSNIDTDIHFEHWSDLLGYLPRAFVVGFTSPFPNMWFEEGRSPGGSLKRLISGFEMIYVYLSLIGVVLLFFCPAPNKEIFFACFAFSVTIIIVYTLVVTNVGALYRFRFGALSLVSCFGLWGWCMFARLIGNRSIVKPFYENV